MPLIYFLARLNPLFKSLQKGFQAEYSIRKTWLKNKNEILMIKLKSMATSARLSSVLPSWARLYSIKAVLVVIYSLANTPTSPHKKTKPTQPKQNQNQKNRQKKIHTKMKPEEGK